MHCTNCNNEVPDTAMVCGYCGHRLREGAQPVKTQANPGTPAWAWWLIGSMVVIVGILFFVIYMLVLKPKPTSPSPEYIPPAIQAISTEKISTPIVISSATPTNRPPTLTPTTSVSRCDLFEELEFSIHWLEFEESSTLGKFYVKFPDGVPGLGVKIQGDNKDWEYRFNIGGNYTTGCTVYKEYPDRLYCEYPFDKTFSNSFQYLKMYVNECETPVYENMRVALPLLPETASKNKGTGNGDSNGDDDGVNGGDTGTSACSSDMDSASCSAAGGSYHYTFCTIPPCPEWCICP